MTQHPEKVLVIRNDKLGDFCLSLPVFALLKQHLPGTEVHALVPGYTKPIAEACPYIDDVITDPGRDAGRHAQLQLLRTLRANRYDAALTLFSTTRVGLLLFAAGIPYRLAPATKLAQVFYNHRLTQRRSRSEKPEYRYNLDLGGQLLRDVGIDEIDLPSTPYLRFDEGELATLRADLNATFKIEPQRRLVFLHPGSGGSASNLSLDQYAELARGLALGDRYALVITAGPDELGIAQSLAGMIPDVPHRIYHSTGGLARFAMHIALCDLFISGSTGPLHIAGALNRGTVGFYPKRRSATMLRWQTLSDDAHRLAFEPPMAAGESEMSAIDIAVAADEINRTLLA